MCCFCCNNNRINLYKDRNRIARDSSCVFSSALYNLDVNKSSSFRSCHFKLEPNVQRNNYEKNQQPVIDEATLIYLFNRIIFVKVTFYIHTHTVVPLFFFSLMFSFVWLDKYFYYPLISGLKTVNPFMFYILQKKFFFRYTLQIFNIGHLRDSKSIVYFFSQIYDHFFFLQKALSWLDSSHSSSDSQCFIKPSNY